MSLPTSSGGGPPGPGGSARLATAARRLVRPSQMDFEYTAWFAVQLLTAPKTAYRHVAYHRQTKLQWARDDPAFALALAFLVSGVGAAHGVGFGGGVSGGLRSAARALVLDFGVLGVLAATAGWAAAAAVGGGGGGGEGGGPTTPPSGVEWLYAFDVHCNAALPALLEVGAVGYALSPWLLRGGAGPALAAALLYAGGALHYSYLTTLGYSAVGPTAARAPEAALYPGMAAAVILPLAALGAEAGATSVGAGGEWADPRAGPRTKRPENAGGTFWVDSKCIDCDTCRRLAPASFARVNGQSAVVSQPPGAATDLSALRALLSCPTSSIHADPAPDKAALAAAAASLPGPVPGVLPQAQGGPPVLYCGLTAGAAFGASAYLLLRGPGRGNVLIDSPRFDKGLAARILAHGPVDFMFLTHRDDVADHAAWAGALACPRIIHAKEANPEQGTDACEVLLDGAGPWSLPDGDADIELFLQPGHTEASVMLHHAPSRSLFPGDVIAFTGSGAGPLGDGPWTVEPPAGPDGTPGLVVHRAYTWFSIPTLLDSLEAGVVGRDWLHLLPGHGRMGSFKSGDARDAALREVIGRERANDAAGAPARSPFF